MTKTQSNMEHLAFLSISSLCIFVYASVAASSLGHIFLLAPGFYFTYYAWGKIKIPTSAKFLFLFIIFAIISVLFSDTVDNPSKKIGELRYFLAGLLSLAAYNGAFIKRFSDSEKFKKSIRFLIYASLAIAAIASINGIVGLYTGFSPLRFKPITDPNRATGLYSMAITFGYGVQFIALVSFCLLIFRKQVKNYIGLLPLLLFSLILFLGLYYSGSRGALLGFIAGLPFCLLRLHKKTFLTLLATGSVGLIIAASIVFSGGSQTSRFLLPSNHDSNLIRLSQYQAAHMAIKERPILGHGYRNFTSQSERIKIEHNIAFPDFISHAHNNYLELWAGSGLFSLLAFMGFLFFWGLEALKRKDIIGDITLTIIMAFAVSGMFQCTVTDAENTFAIMLIYGLSHISQKRILAVKGSLPS